MRFVDEFKMRYRNRDWKWLLAIGIFALIGVKILGRVLGGSVGFASGLISVFLIPVKIILVLASALAGVAFVIFLIGFVGSWIAGSRYRGNH
jgi:hypothetical protein